MKNSWRCSARLAALPTLFVFVSSLSGETSYYATLRVYYEIPTVQNQLFDDKGNLLVPDPVTGAITNSFGMAYFGGAFPGRIACPVAPGTTCVERNLGTAFVQQQGVPSAPFPEALDLGPLGGVVREPNGSIQESTKGTSKVMRLGNLTGSGPWPPATTLNVDVEVKYVLVLKTLATPPNETAQVLVSIKAENLKTGVAVQLPPTVYTGDRTINGTLGVLHLELKPGVNNTQDLQISASLSGMADKVTPTPVVPPSPPARQLLSEQVPKGELGLASMAPKTGQPFEIRAKFKNLTTNSCFILPFVFLPDAAATRNVMRTFEPAVTPASLGGDGILSPGETTSELLFQVEHQNRQFSYWVNAYAVVVSVEQDKRLWYFNGESPAPFTDGATTVTLTAANRTKGTFKWEITTGADKAVFENGLSAITKTDDNTVKLSSTKASAAFKDVTIKLTIDGSPCAQHQLEVRAPQKLVSKGATTHRGVSTSCDVEPYTPGNNGFQSLIPYEVRNQFDEKVAKAGINETFGAETNVEPNDWPFGAGALWDTDGTFVDNVCTLGAFSPHPLAPQSPRSGRRIDQVLQDWFSGSGTTPTGRGVHVQRNDLVRFIDHGEHQSIQSPPR